MIYLDNAATTKPNARAIEKAKAYLTDNYFNPSASYKEGFALQTELKKARASLLSHIADEGLFELIFTSCGTESDNTAVFGYGRRGNVVTTAGEHSAVYAAVAELKNRGMAEPRYAPLNRDGSVNVEALLNLVDEKTSLVSVMHVNNETGAINDINAIAKAVKAKNPKAVFHSDGVQGYGKLMFKLSANVDLYSVSAHKIGGLKGVGALIKKKSLPFHAFLIGGGQESGRRSGTENVFGVKAFEYAAEEKFFSLKEDNERLNAYKKLLISTLDKNVYTSLSGENSSPYILSVAARGLRGEILLHMANDKGLIVGTGSACSTNAKLRYSRVILACGYDEKTADGVLRVSFSPETTEEEIVEATKILNEIGAELQRRMR